MNSSNHNREAGPASAPAEQSGGLRRLFRWGTQGGLAITDQALISGSNFLIGILLARWLQPEQYGAYALAFSIYLLLLLLYQSLLLEPLSVFGGSTYWNGLRGYLRSLLWIHVALAVFICSVLGLAAFGAHLLGRHSLQGALAGVTFAAPCVLLFWLARRVFYLGLPLIYAAGSSLLYCSVVVVGLLLLNRKHALSPFTALLVMGSAALATSGLLFARMWARVYDGPSPGVLHTWRHHWGYGRWALLGAIAGWIPGYIYYPLLTASGHIAHAAELRALMNIDLPVQQIYAALSLLFLPYASRMHARAGTADAGKIARRITLLFTAGAGLYWAILLPLRSHMLGLLYSGKYNAVGRLLPFVALESVITGAVCGPAIVLRSMERPSAVFWARFAGAGVTITFGALATWRFGIPGVVGVMISSSLVSLLTAFYLLYRRLPHPAAAPGGVLARVSAD
jgi:O-antigen/teichoic acid export membrane protein